MTQQLEALAEEGVPQEPRIRALKGGHYIYYRQPNGHIAPGSAQKMDMSNYIEGNWRPLSKYGTFYLDHVTINHPLDHLFRKGGAKELPVSQLVEEGWAYRDYYVDGAKVEFPQLIGKQIPPLEECEFCGHKAIHQGLEGHREVQHQRDVGSVKLGEMIAKALRGEEPVILAEGQQVTVAPYLCGRCGAGFNSHMPLAKHVKKEHGNAN